MIELRQAPIYQPQFALLMIYHDIVRLHISVHYPLWMAVLQRLNIFVMSTQESIYFCNLKNSTVEDNLFSNIENNNWLVDMCEGKQMFCKKFKMWQLTLIEAYFFHHAPIGLLINQCKFNCLVQIYLNYIWNKPGYVIWKAILCLI